MRFSRSRSVISRTAILFLFLQAVAAAAAPADGRRRGAKKIAFVGHAAGNCTANRCRENGGCASCEYFRFAVPKGATIVSIKYQSTAGYPDDVPLREVGAGETAWSFFEPAHTADSPTGVIVTSTFYNRSDNRERQVVMSVEWDEALAPIPAPTPEPTPQAFEQDLTVGGTRLHLNGVGSSTYPNAFSGKQTDYRIALYLERPTSDADVVLLDSTSKMAVLQFATARPKDYVESLFEGAVRAPTGLSDEARAFLRFLPAVQVGSKLGFVYQAGTRKTYVLSGGGGMHEIPYPWYAGRIFGMWVGRFCIYPSIEPALLGLSPQSK